VHLSPRQFSRRFRSATGASPAAWLLRRRLDASLPLLESSDEPVEQVAARVGFGTPAAFRRHFARAYGVPPSAWRRAFAASRPR
jgi:AraC family transcriptional activator FtrA